MQLACSPPLCAVRVRPPASLVDVRAPPACSVWVARVVPLARRVGALGWRRGLAMRMAVRHE